MGDLRSTTKRYLFKKESLKSRCPLVSNDVACPPRLLLGAVPHGSDVRGGGSYPKELVR